MKRLTLTILLLITFFMWISCPTPNIENNVFDLSQSSLFEENSTLFNTNPDTGESVFSVNKVSPVLTGGATYWSEREPEGALFEPIEVILRKSSGHGGGGYGIFFSQREGGTDLFNSLVLFINILGEYCAGIIHDQSFEYIIPWTGSEFLIKGYGQNNIIRIEAAGNMGQYILIFNGNPVNIWEDPSDEVHGGSGFGYIAVITPLENFPSIPVTIWYKDN